MRYDTKSVNRCLFGFILLSVLFLTCLFAYKNVTPVITMFASTTAMNHATKSVNETVDQYLKSLHINYSDIAQIHADADSKVTAIKIDSGSLNQLKTGITASVADLFKDVKTAQMKIPIGTLSGSSLLAGKGMGIPFFVSYSATAESELSNLFVTRGINQTQHRIILQIRVRVQVLSYGKTEEKEITTQITLAETVIVGTIPEIYAGAEDELWPNLVE